MSESRSDFSQGKVSGLIFRLGLPIMFAELVHVLYNIVDRMYIGRMAESGTQALTGMGVCFPLITFIGAFANLCSTGGATLSTIARGEGDDNKAERIMATSFTLLILIGAALTVLLSVTAGATLRWLGGDEVTLPLAKDYFYIYAVGTIPVLISLGMNSFINAQGFPRVGMMTVILGAALNIGLDPLFIFAFDLGIKGAAIATVISQSVSAVWVVRFLTGRQPPVRLKRLYIDKRQLVGIVKLGVTGFTFKVTNSITQALVNVMLKNWGGVLSALYIGAAGLINSLREIMSLPTNSMTAAGQSVMSYNYGAKKYARVSECIRFTLVCTLIVDISLWALTMLKPDLLIHIFSDDPELIALSAKCARVYFGSFPFMALQLTGQTTFVALNYPRYALFFSLLRKIVLVVPLTLLLPGLGFGVMGVFWAELFSQLIGSTICFITMYNVVWKHTRASL